MCKREIAELKKSPLFNVSLSSKELFHSNFIAWFFEKHKEDTVLYFKELVPEFQITELLIIEREKKNIDITLIFNNAYSVLIENKVKSLPNRSQLDDYSNKINQEKERLILLSLYPDSYKPFLSYKEVLAWMEKVNERSVNSENKNSLKEYYVTKDYIEFTMNLASISNSLMEADVKFNFHSQSNIYKQFQDIRLHDIFHKIKYKRLNDRVSTIVYKWLENELNIPQKDHSQLYSAENYFSRGTAAANFHFPINGDPKFRKYFEIQLQDNMLRFILFSVKCVKFQEYINSKELFRSFFDLANTQSTLFETPKMRNEFNKYGDYIIYKYLIIKDNCDMLELVQILANLIQRVILNLNNKQNQIDNFLDDPKGTYDEISWS